MAAQRREGIAGDGERRGEVFRRGIEIAAFQLFFVGEGDGVDKKIEPAPARFDFPKQGFDARIIGHVARQNDVRAHRTGERQDAFFQGLALIAECQFRAMAGGGAGDAPSERALIGDAHDEPPLSCHEQV